MSKNIQPGKAYRIYGRHADGSFQPETYTHSITVSFTDRDGVEHSETFRHRYEGRRRFVFDRRTARGQAQKFIYETLKKGEGVRDFTIHYGGSLDPKQIY